MGVPNRWRLLAPPLWLLGRVERKAPRDALHETASASCDHCHVRWDARAYHTVPGCLGTKGSVGVTNLTPRVAFSRKTFGHVMTSSKRFLDRSDVSRPSSLVEVSLLETPVFSLHIKPTLALPVRHRKVVQIAVAAVGLDSVNLCLEVVGD